MTSIRETAAPPIEAIAPYEPGGVSVAPFRRFGQRFLANRSAFIALGFLVVLVAVAILAPWLTPEDPSRQHLTRINEGPSRDFWLGTDDLGRDILSRIVIGTRVSMRVALQVVLVATVAAVPLGLLAGYFGRWADAVLMRVMDALFTVPPLILALAVASLLGPSLNNAAFAIAVVFVPGFVRVIRAQVLAIREETFIEASRSIGTGPVRIIARHVLPNVASPLIVQVALGFGYALLAEAGLSFLGLGAQSPDTSWGLMLRGAYDFILEEPWPLIPPGVAIVIAVLVFNLVGDGLRDSLGRETVTLGLER